MSMISIPAPIGGWNARDSLDGMQPVDAVTMKNFIPRENAIELRKGSLKQNTTVINDAINTMATYRQADGTEILIACGDSKVYKYDVSTDTLTQLASGFTNSKFQTVNFNNYILFVNGADAPKQYDGTTFGNYTSAVSGATGTDLKGITVYKGRCYYWENNASKFWYAAAGAYGGALTAFQLDLTAKKGGYVVECCSWTRDSGDGVDDLFVVLMSTGETLVYSGDDPGSNFSLIGRFNLGKPLSIRGSENLASDRIIVTEDGFVNLSYALQSGRMTDAGNVSSKIISACKEQAKLYPDVFGWDIIFHPRESLLIINIPSGIQFAMNTNTGGWCEFKGLDIQSWTIHDGKLYAGGSDGYIREIFTGTSDDGNVIAGSVIPAFTALGNRSNQKQLTYVTVTTTIFQKKHIGLAGLADFDIISGGDASIPQSGVLAEWGVTSWGSGNWSGGESNVIKNHNMQAKAFGYAISCKLRIKTSLQTPKIYSFKYNFKTARSI